MMKHNLIGWYTHLDLGIEEALDKIAESYPVSEWKEMEATNK
jgi:hypothetical protein